MNRQDIIVLPYHMDWPQCHTTGISENMENMAFVRTGIIWTLGEVQKIKTHTACVISQEEEVVPLICAYYGFEQMGQPVLFRSNRELFKEYHIPLHHIPDQMAADRLQEVHLSIYRHFAYPSGENAIARCNNIVLCSQWGYNQIQSWIED